MLRRSITIKQALRTRQRWGLTGWSLTVVLTGYLMLSLGSWLVQGGFHHVELHFRVVNIEPFNVDRLTEYFWNYGLWQPFAGDQEGKLIITTPNSPLEPDLTFIPEDTYTFADSLEYIGIFTRSIDVLNAPLGLFVPLREGYTLAHVREARTGKSAKTGNGLFLAPGRLDVVQTHIYWVNRLMVIAYLWFLYALLAEGLLATHVSVGYLGSILFKRSRIQLVVLCLCYGASWCVLFSYSAFQNPTPSFTDFMLMLSGGLFVLWRCFRALLRANDYVHIHEESVVFQTSVVRREIFYEEMVELSCVFVKDDTNPNFQEVSQIVIRTVNHKYVLDLKLMNLKPFGWYMFQELNARRDYVHA